MRWWKRGAGSEATVPGQSPARHREGFHTVASPAAVDPTAPWVDLCSTTAVRLLDLVEPMSGQLDKAMHDQDDPDVLDHLYALDAFVCRARRYAENLQVLTGRNVLDTDRQVTSLTDIIQAARCRIAGWKAVTVGRVAHIAVGEYVASDVIRVMTELLDNAVRYCPVGGPVTASGHLLADGGALLRIEDTGIGFTEADLRRYNAFLREATPGVASVQQGFAVIRRVIHAHGIQVFLAARTPRGTTAHVWIPPGLLCEIAVGRAAADVPYPAAGRSWAPPVAPLPRAACPAIERGAAPGDSSAPMPKRVPQRMRPVEPGSPAIAPAPPVINTADPLAGIADFDAATREGPSTT